MLLKLPVPITLYDRPHARGSYTRNPDESHDMPWTALEQLVIIKETLTCTAAEHWEDVNSHQSIMVLPKIMTTNQKSVRTKCVKGSILKMPSIDGRVSYSKGIPFWLNVSGAFPAWEEYLEVHSMCFCSRVQYCCLYI